MKELKRSLCQWQEKDRDQLLVTVEILLEWTKELAACISRGNPGKSEINTACKILQAIGQAEQDNRE